MYSSTTTSLFAPTFTPTGVLAVGRGAGISPREEQRGHDPDGSPHAQRSTVALVTGAGRGIGRLLASALAGEGVAVGLLARSGDELAEVAAAIESAGGAVAVAPADVTDPAAVAAAVAEVAAELGPIDLLVNNAGIPGPIGPLWAVDAEAWWTTFDVNVRGILLATQAVLPAMVAKRRGRIVNMSSQAGAHRWPLMSGYSVSKAAVTKLTENLAHETARYGVSVFSVHPGLLPIGMSTTVLGGTVTTPYDEIVQRWTAAQLRNGGGAEPSAAVELLLRIAEGDADALSGRHLSVHDDLDTLLADVAEIRRRDLYVLRPERLRTRVAPSEPVPSSSASASASDRIVRRSNATPSSYLGRPAERWRTLLAAAHR
jgi:NAD(P)-dependent dehydrogenase (short-subunit alcohol dehydrogenase family)